MLKILGVITLALLSFNVWATPININKAQAQSIADGLNGIGLTKAEEIVRHREQHGDFKSLKELEDVKGIGPKTLERNADKIIFSDGE
ncbi:helix-hairpin-helix domain-containing protein [Thiomicrospira sp. R3]|uniref:ComEA family DNA-binding protein n=1 Tax=Thiomicrospira sp. R3 TaxID=3035472 RepID=UPI00259AEFAE|nr:helix-hairpin-helix domain-containing protein [Thiomicrospira sp. R3]WFE68275.1 helix-hairpin-helix domain-containing protein [Thiomicrospira sp. R3]